MPHFLDALPFDWSRPESRELHDFLAGVYFREGPVVEFAVRAGVKPASVAWDRPMHSVWHDLITKARNQNRLRALLERVAEGDEAVGLRLRELMAADPVVEAPAAADSGVVWKGFDARGGWERQIFDEPTLLDVAFMRRGAELAPGVVRLLVELPGGRAYGTAFRIGADLLLTNHHVLYGIGPGPGRATRAEAWLHYELDTAARHRAHTVVRCRPETITGDPAHDWAVIRSDGPLPDDIPVSELATAEPVSVGERVYVIQHPKGGVKKIGMHHNIVRHVDDDVIQYWTDTEAGSSGSPVFNERWQLIALHHRWVAVEEERGKREFRNQGRRISRVAEGLAAAGVL
ncbi:MULTISPECIES: trypsin-like peptidase domain-containing protein [Streptomyces]|uniref:Trypsin-like peptidase domain-containing protein n=1 Tax=Streptomyces lonegramiae TaxID=3075524 RepID=A0ABU2XVX7_9ACTN|nr:trypsin-like peptidase domain-containing protein [Streptomyces sp. DSM 41529]MDT0549690.1 trypsin-like peptidase domain-containing protein [Streptomyces sp. DSM 41529]